MKDTSTQIMEWTNERTMGVPTNETMVYCILEELFEMLGFEDDTCKELAITYSDEIMLSASITGTNQTTHGTIDALFDIRVFAENFITRLGYDPLKVANEGIKEISSRTGAMNAELGKWQKFQTDEAKALWYQADYTDCKL